jgi:hypothetical protein
LFISAPDATRFPIRRYATTYPTTNEFGASCIGCYEYGRTFLHAPLPKLYAGFEATAIVVLRDWILKMSLNLLQWLLQIGPLPDATGK